MARNDDFERLKAARSNAHKSKNCARSIMDDSRFLLSEAVDDAHMAYRDMRLAYDSKIEALDVYVATKLANQPQIERLDQKVEEAFENVRQAARLSRAAYLSGNHPLAREQSAEKVRYIDLKREYTAERSRLIQEIQSLRIAYEEASKAFELTKVVFRTTRDACEPLVAAFEEARRAHKSACEVFAAADDAVQKYITARSIDEERALVVGAGVPPEFVDRTWVRYSSDGVRHFYFGGI